MTNQVFISYLVCQTVLCPADCVECLAAIMDKAIWSRRKFRCSEVVHQLKPCEVVSWQNATAADRIGLRKTILKRGKVQTAKYKKRQRRWINDEVECELCGRWYGVNELEHNAAYCSQASGEPITERNLAYPFAYLKRFKHLTRKVP